MRTNDPARPAPVGPAAARAPAVGRSAFAAAIALLLIAPDSRAGGAFISGDDSDANGHCEEDNCGRMIGHVLRDLYERCEPLPPGDCILAVGANADQALSALVGGQGRLGWNSPVNGGPGACVVHCDSVPCILGVDFADYRLLYVPSDEHDTSGGITQEQLDALITRQADIQAWVNDRDGRVLALTESRLDNPFGWLPNPLTFDLISTNDARRTPDPANPAVAEIDQEFPGNGSTDDNIDHNRYHNMFVGPSGWSGMRVLLEATDESIDDPVDPDRRIPAPLAVGCCSCLLIAEDCSNGVDDDGDGLVDEKDEDCTPCGDGVLDPGEECDDGNLRNGDGCDVRCRVEDNGPPACSLPAAFAADCRDVRDGLFRLDGSGASDPDGDPLHLHWSAQCPEISFQDDEDEFPVVLADGPPPCPVSCRVTLTVSDPSGASATCETLVTVTDTTAPELADCPRDLPGDCSSVPAQGIPVVTDDCDPAPVLLSDETRIDGPCADAYTIARTWTARDACGNSSGCAQEIDVRDTTPPILHGVGADADVECGAVPPPSNPTATDDCDPAPGMSGMVETRSDGPCPGSYALERAWTATDRCGNAASSAQVITVRDTTGPVIDEGSGGEACLWPPNHWYVCFTTADFRPVVHDACSEPVTWRFVGCASDQPDDAPDGPRRRGEWNGDGHTSDDCVLAADGQGFCVRAERAGAGRNAQAGRRYGVMGVATDACGNESAAVMMAAVHVPHDQSPRERDCLDPTRVGLRREGGRRP